MIGRSTVIESINQIRLEEYQYARLQEPSTTRKGYSVAPATIDKELQCLRAALNKGMEAKLISSNPIKTLPQFNKDNSRDQDISHEEFKEFLGYLPLYMQHIVTIAYWLGMRQGEITNLTWNKVDLKKRVIRLTTMDTKEKRKKVIVIFDTVQSPFLKSGYELI